MIRHFTVSLFLLALLITIAGAQTPPPGVNVKLSFAENKTVYRMGEPIKLVMEFTADREGFIVEVLPDGSEPGSDTVVVSPDAGITRWWDELSDNSPYGRHVFSTAKLTATPRRVEIIVNDRLRFESPGRYTVSVTTRRLSQGSQPLERSTQLVVLTNSLNFEIVSMSEADEAKEVKRISDLLDATRGPQSQISNQLCYLTGDVSTREKVRRFLSPEHQHWSGPYMWSGLFIARNRALVLKLLEAGMRDPKIPVTLNLLSAATRLKTLLTHGPREKPVNPAPRLLEREENPQAREIRDAYIAEIAAGLAKRTRENQTSTALTILMLASSDSHTTGAGRREARQILIQHFDSLHPFTQDLLLRAHWDALRDPAVVPSLKKILATSSMESKGVRQTMLKRLLEMAPDEARPYVIAEIRDPSSRVEPEVLGALEDKSLPEVDTALLDQIREAAASPQNTNQIYLKFKVALVVRFGTANIYQELMQLYRTVGEKLDRESRAGLLAYFAKHNEREAIPLIEEIISSEFKPGSSPWTLSELTKLYYSDSIGEILKKLLESNDYAHASHAAYLIGREGSAGDERVLEARLKRWREEWRDRVADADAQHQGQVERELISALINGKSWKLSPERVEELKKSCITKLCKETNLVRQ